MVRPGRTPDHPPPVAGEAPASGRTGRASGPRAPHHSLAGRRTPPIGLDALLDAIEGLQGAPLVASILETEILPARVEGYQPSDLDALTTAGEVVWGGLEPLGEHDGRLALYLTDHVAKLRREPGAGELPERKSLANWPPLRRSLC